MLVRLCMSTLLLGDKNALTCGNKIMIMYFGNETALVFGNEIVTYLFVYEKTPSALASWGKKIL